MQPFETSSTTRTQANVSRCTITRYMPGFTVCSSPPGWISGQRSLQVARGVGAHHVKLRSLKVSSVAKAADLPDGPSKLTARQLLRDAVQLFKPIMWPVFWIYVFDVTIKAFLDRISHRLINAIFLTMHKGFYSPEHIGSLWYLSVNPDITTFATGYSQISYGMVLLFFPLSIAVSTMTVLGLYHLAQQELDKPTFEPAAAAPKAKASVPRTAGAPPPKPGSASASKGSEKSEDVSTPTFEADVKAEHGTEASQPETDPTEGRSPSRAASRAQSEVVTVQDRASMQPDSASSHQSTPVNKSADDSGSASAVASNKELIASTSSHSDVPTRAGPSSDSRNTGTGSLVPDGKRQDAQVPGAAPKAAKKSYLLDKPAQPRFWAIRRAGATLRLVATKHLSPVFATHLLANSVTYSMFFLSCFLVSLPFTVPRAMNVQLAILMARYHGLKRKAALEESKAWMQGHRKPVFIAMATALFIAVAALPLGNYTQMMIPIRIAMQVPEILAAQMILAHFLTFAAHQVKNLIPFLAFQRLSQQRQAIPSS